MKAKHPSIKLFKFHNGTEMIKNREKVYIKPISKRKFKQLKQIQLNRMQYEDYSYLELFK